MRRLAALLGLLLAGCGGAGNESGGSGVRAAQQMGTATLTLMIPTSSTHTASVASTSRHVLYVDPATQSVGVSVNGSAAQVTNVGSSSPNCASISGGLSCSVDFSAPYGADTFAISLYSGQNGTGSVIGTASASGNVSLGSPFVINATVQGTYVAYVNAGNALALYTENGALQTMLPIASVLVDVDDAGNIYNLASGLATTVQHYPAGSVTSDYSYQPTGSSIYGLAASGTGELLIFSGTPSTVFEVWKAGTHGGPPDYSLPYGGVFAYVMEHDGTLVIPSNNGVTAQYDFYPPGSSTSARTITESIVSPANIPYFYANDMTVGPDGTLYVNEFTFGSFGSADALTGLYIYPPSGPERFVATTSDVNGGGANGLALDAAGNIYVANSNAILNISTCSPGPCQYYPDTLHDIEVFAPGGTSVLRHITGNWDAYQLSVTPDGTLFFDTSDQVSTDGTYYSPANSSASTLLQPYFTTEIPLYDGVQQYEPESKRRVSSASQGAKHGGTASLGRLRLAAIKERLARLKSH